MKFTKNLSKAVLPLLLLIPSLSSAAIVLPALDVQYADASNGSGFALTAGSLNIEAAIIGIKLDDIGGFTNITPNKTITLTSTAGSYDFGTGGGFFDGTFSVSGDLLSGTFTHLLVLSVNGGFDVKSTLPGSFDGFFTYTGGSLAGSLGTTGEIELTVGSNGTFSGKLGQVSPVPVPAAVWLFGSGLLGLVGVARRRA